MFNITNPKCPCGTYASFNFQGEKARIFCGKCRLPEMVDVSHKKCIGQDGKCTQVAGNKVYKGYCAYCYQNTFPEDPISFQIKFKTKEMAVREYINQRFEGFIHDKCLETSHCDCTVRRRPDHRILIDGTLLCIETDENQHKSYSEMDEETRYNDLFMAYSGKWIYIRFNPDKFKDVKAKSKNPRLSTRLQTLGDEIERQIGRIKNGENEELVERVYMYYDEA